MEYSNIGQVLLQTGAGRGLVSKSSKAKHLQQERTDMLRLDPKTHDAVIFDCDGTLVDTMPLHHRAWQASFDQFGAPFQFTWELFTRRAGMTLEATVLELNEEFGCCLPAAEVAAAQRLEYRRQSANIQPIPHVVQFARALAPRHPLAVASGSGRTTVLDALTQISLLEIFRAIVTPADVARGKPAPDLFLLAAARLGVSPSRCLVVEDGALGLQAARDAGMDAYCVDRDGGVTWLPATNPSGSPEGQK